MRPAVSLRGGSKTGPGRRRKSNLVSYGFLMRLTIGLILKCRDGWAQWHVKIHRRELERIVYSLKSSSNFKALFWTKKSFERIPSRPEFACKFADWFSSVFQSLQMHCRVFCNLADSSSVKTNHEIMIFTAKKSYRHVFIQVQAFRRKPKKLRLFGRKKNAWGLNWGKRKSINGKLHP